MSIEKEATMFKYIGGKGRMVGVLSRLIPKTCTIYAEPYCGSAALALNCGNFSEKLLNDLNPNISNFHKMAVNPETRGELLRQLQQTRYSKSAFDMAKARCELHGAKRKDYIQWAVDTYILVNQSFNGDARNWVYGNAEAYQRKLTDPLGLPLAFKSMQGQAFRVYNENAIELMKQQQLLSNPKAFIFLDPPYLEGLRSDAKLYMTDMPDVRDHINLLKAIRTAKAKILLSGYWSGKDDGTDLYDYYLLPYGWHRHLLGEYTKGCEVGDTKSKGAEWLWSNYELAKEAPSGLAFLKSYCDDKKSPCLQEWLALQSPNQK
jgi:site-specific DNA-adenine methylase